MKGGLLKVKRLKENISIQLVICGRNAHTLLIVMTVHWLTASGNKILLVGYALAEIEIKVVPDQLLILSLGKRRDVRTI